MARPTDIRLLLAAAGASAALFLAACGGNEDTSNSADKFKGEEKAVAQALEDLSEAGEEKDTKRICSELLAKDLVSRLDRAGVDCSKRLEESLDRADVFDLTVKSVKVEGETATAVVSSRDAESGQSSSVTLVKEDGRWRLATLG